MIYLISDGELVKIGYSKQPQKRLAQLQTGNPKKLKLIHTFEVEIKGKLTERIIERKIHHLLRQFKVSRKGEWFNLSESEFAQLIDIIESILNHSN